MLQKLKKINISRFNKITQILAIFVLIAVFLFAPLYTLAAQSYQVEQINLTTSIQQNGTEVSSLKLGKNGLVNFDVVVTLASPDQINLLEDKIVANNSLTFNRIIYGFGASVTAFSTTTGGSCFKETLDSVSFIKCDGPLRFSTAPNQNDLVTIPEGTQKSFKKGDVVFKRNFIINGQKIINDLGLSNVKSSSNSGLNQIMIYPLVNMADDFLSFQNAGKSIIVKLYETDAEKNADTTDIPSCNGDVIRYDTNGKPTCAPGAGSNTGSGTNTGDSGSPLLGFFNQVLGIILGFLQELIFAVYSYFIVPLIQAMLEIQTYKDSFMAVIYPGWEIIRNLGNIIMIVAIIAIGLGTIFRIEKYQYKHLLVNLIVAALLVNFSLVIMQAILGIADTIQSQFLPNNSEVIRALGRDIMVGYRDVIYNGATFSSKGYFSNTIAPFFYLALAMGSVVVFGSIAGFLTVRIVYLWVLAMLSPLPYLANILPSTESMSSKWWSEFLKYAFFTPIMAFFLNMSAVILTSYKTNPVLKTISSADLGNNGLSEFVFKTASNVVVLVFLYLAIKITEDFGIAGANIMTKAAQGGMMNAFKPLAWAGGLAKMGASRGFEGIQNISGVTLDPSIWKHEAEEYFKKEKHNRMLKREGHLVKGVPLGAPRDLLENYWNMKGLKRVTKSKFGLDGFKDNVKKANENKELSEIMTEDEEVTALDKIRENGIKVGELQDTSKNLKQGKVKDVLANQMVGKIDSKLLKLAEEKTKLIALEADLASKGLSTASTRTKIDEVQALEDELNTDKGIIENQLAAGATTVDVNSILNGRSEKHDNVFKESVFNKDEEAGKINSQIDKLNQEREAQNGSLVKSQQNREKYKNNKKYGDKLKNKTWSKEDRKNALNDYAKFKQFSEQVERPEAYYARAARLSREGEESKKISDIEEEAELNKLLRNAVYQKDTPKAIAILKKLTKDRNLNEATEDWGYTTDYGGDKGVKAFMEMILHEKLGMAHNEVMEVATEIGYIAEGSKQYNAARMTIIDETTGHLTWMPEDLQAQIVFGELSKSEARKRFGDLPRWNYVVEGVDAYGNRTIEGWTKFGKKILVDAAGNAEAVRNISSQGNTYAMKAIMKLDTWRQDLIDEGLAQGKRRDDLEMLVDAVETCAGKGTGKNFGAKK